MKFGLSSILMTLMVGPDVWIDKNAQMPSSKNYQLVLFK